MQPRLEFFDHGSPAKNFPPSSELFRPLRNAIYSFIHPPGIEITELAFDCATQDPTKPTYFTVVTKKLNTPQISFENCLLSPSTELKWSTLLELMGLSLSSKQLMQLIRKHRFDCATLLMVLLYIKHHLWGKVELFELQAFVITKAELDNLNAHDIENLKVKKY